MNIEIVLTLIILVLVPIIVVVLMLVDAYKQRDDAKKAFGTLSSFEKKSLWFGPALLLSAATLENLYGEDQIILNVFISLIQTIGTSVFVIGAIKFVKEVHNAQEQKPSRSESTAGQPDS
ncbi:hypothetical protein [Microbulbifer pacificus]|uniref:DUF1616 domain-containing protein n=1 Tax=Microbulbifer pacificus TaxID=407164 RepID=A0AAU0N053_9GAMM|nr:hypothetical protein [Microbulbifer pacificus]WOX05059.1 hypothetical protein R5R33_15120 [Microbulbifer pacificus]